MTVGYQFVPNFQYITAITNAFPCVVTFTTNHNFVLGNLVSFRTSKPDGMPQLNQVTGRVVALTADTVSVDVDTRDLGTFVYPSTATTPPILVSVGSGLIPNSNDPLLIQNPATITLAAAFDNEPVD